MSFESELGHATTGLGLGFGRQALVKGDVVFVDEEQATENCSDALPQARPAILLQSDGRHLGWGDEVWVK